MQVGIVSTCIKINLVLYYFLLQNPRRKFSMWIFLFTKGAILMVYKLDLSI
jgi:hypothetical protein